MLASARPSPYLTAAEAAAYLRYPTVKAIYQAVRAGRIPTWCVSRRGRCLLFNVRALDQWLHEDTMRPDRPRRQATVFPRPTAVADSATSTS